MFKAFAFLSSSFPSRAPIGFHADLDWNINISFLIDSKWCHLPLCKCHESSLGWSLSEGRHNKTWETLWGQKSYFFSFKFFFFVLIASQSGRHIITFCSRAPAEPLICGQQCQFFSHYSQNPHLRHTLNIISMQRFSLSIFASHPWKT